MGRRLARSSLARTTFISVLYGMEVSEVELNGAKRFAGITILEGYNANISIVAALWADSDGTRDASR
jgi:hypothetical protein